MGIGGIIGTSFFILLHLDRQGMLMIYIVGAILFLLQLCEGRGETRALKHVEIFFIFQIFKHVQYGETTALTTDKT